MPTVPGFALDLEPPLPRVAIGHGALDPVISRRVEPRRARGASRRPARIVTYHESPHMAHSIDPAFLRQLPAWLADTLASRRVKLATGAELRITGAVDECAVVCVNGGQSREVEGTWSASIEWLVDDARAAAPGARIRGGPLPGEVVAAARVVRRGCACSGGRGRRAAHRAPRLLDGRRRVHRDRERADRRGGRRPRAVDPRPARRDDPPRQAAHRLPRRARPLAPGYPGRLGGTLAARATTARASAAPRAATSLIPGALHGVALRTPVGEARAAAEGGPLGRARRGGAAALRQ